MEKKSVDGQKVHDCWREKGSNVEQIQEVWRRRSLQHNNYIKVRRETEVEYQKDKVNKCKDEPKLFHNCIKSKTRVKDKIQCMSDQGKTYSDEDMSACVRPWLCELLAEVLGFRYFLSFISSLTTSLCKWVIKIRLEFCSVFRKINYLTRVYFSLLSHDENYKQSYYDSWVWSESKSMNCL